MSQFPEVIHLNVGGTLFVTKLVTLRKYKNSILGEMFNGQIIPDQDKDGNYFIDRNGKYFDHIIEFLRDENYLPPVEVVMEVIKEADYYILKKYMDRLNRMQPL